MPRDLFAQSKPRDLLAVPSTGPRDLLATDKPAAPSDIVQGLKRGTYRLGANIARTGEAVQTALGGEKGFFARTAEAAEKRAAELPARVGGVEDIQGVGDVADYAQSIIAEQTPQFGPTIAGAAIGSRFHPVWGTLAGAALPALAQNIGEQYGEQREQGVDDPTKAIGYGSAASALDVVTPGRIVKRVLSPGRGGFLKRAAKGAVEGTIGESVTETGQEELAIRHRATYDPVYKAALEKPVAGEPAEVTAARKEIGSRRLNAAVAGALVGGTAGSVGGAVQKRTDTEAKPDRVIENTVAGKVTPVDTGTAEELRAEQLPDEIVTPEAARAPESAVQPATTEPLQQAATAQAAQPVKNQVDELTKPETADERRLSSPEKRARVGTLKQRIDDMEKKVLDGKGNVDELIGLIRELHTERSTDELTGLKSRTAWNEATRLPAQASIDLDGLKTVNDEMGHLKGDEMFRKVAAAFKETIGDEVYRVGGDEFVAQAKDAATLDAALKSAQDMLSGSTITATLPDGSTVTKHGIEYSYVVDQTYEAADAKLKAEKDRRAKAGLRAETGGKLPGLVKTPAQGQPTQRADTAEKTSTSEADLTENLKEDNRGTLDQGSPRPSGLVDEQNLQVRGQQTGAEILSGLPQNLYEAVAKIQPAKFTATEKRQLQELRGRMSEKGQTPAEAVRAVFGPELADASPRLRQAITRGLAVSEMPSGAAPEGTGSSVNAQPNLKRAPTKKAQPEAVEPVKKPVPVSAQDEVSSQEYISPKLKRDFYRTHLKTLSDSLVRNSGGEMIGGDFTEANWSVARGKETAVQRLPSLNPEWFKRMNTDPDYTMSVKDVQAAVEKALAGKRLGMRQARIVQSMIDQIESRRTDPDNIAFVKAELKNARDMRQLARQGIDPDLIVEIPAYIWEQDAGRVYEEVEYQPDWSGQARSLFELSNEAEQMGLSKEVEDILSKGVSDLVAARQILTLIGEANAERTQQRERTEDAAQQPEKTAQTEEAKDLFGEAPVKEQRLADAKRSVDEKLKGTEDVPVEAGEGDLFSGRTRQRDFTQETADETQRQKSAETEVLSEDAKDGKPTDKNIEQRIADAEANGVELSEKDKKIIRETQTKADDLARKAYRTGNTDPMNKGNAFPMGVGYTKMTKRKEQAIDASVRKAGEAVKLWNKAKTESDYVDKLLSGKGTEADIARKEIKKSEGRRRIVETLLNWKKGDKLGGFTIERINRDRDGYPASYTISGEGIIKGVQDKVNVVKELFGGDIDQFRSLVDELSKPEKRTAKPAQASGARAFDQKVTESQELSYYDGYGNTGQIQEPRRAVTTEAVQRDLFASADLSPEQKAGAAKAIYRTLYKQVAVGKIKSGLDVVKNLGSAAHVLAPFRKHGQETMLALVLDKDGKILNLIRHTKGLADQSSVNPALLAGSIADTPDAAQYVLAHNHPSGDPNPSRADKIVTERIQLVMDGTDIDFMGHVVLGEGTKAWGFNDFTDEPIEITALPRKRDIEITERIVRKVADGNRPQLTQPQDSIDLAKTINDQGIVLLDNKHRMVGFIPINDTDWVKLKGGKEGKQREILSALSKTNTVAAVIISNKNVGTPGRELHNVAKFLTAAEIRVLDHIASGTSIAMTGLDPSPTGVYFSKYSTLPAGRKALGMRVDAVEKIIDEHRKTLDDNRLDVTVVKTQEEIFPGRKERIKGAYSPRTGGIVLIAENLDGRTDAIKTYAFETIGRYGLDTFDAETQTQIIDKVKSSRDLKSFEKIWTEVDRDYSEASEEVKARTVFARAAATPQTHLTRLWNEIMRIIQSALRKMGMLQNLTRTDLRLIAETIADNIRRGETNVSARGEGFEFSKAKDSVSELKPTNEELRAWNLGKKHRGALDGKKPNTFFYENMPQTELDFVSDMEVNSPVQRAFYESALRGAKMPSRAIGWRFGKAKDKGVSKNYTDDTDELGISMAGVDGGDYQWYPMSKVGEPNYYEGWLLDPDEFRGSDNEPLMVGLTKTEKASIAQPTQSESFDQPTDYAFKESDYRPEVVSWAKEKWADKVADNGKPVWQNFVRWFGESVVTLDGKPGSAPLAVYHWTDSEFDTFDTEGTGGSHFGTKQSALDRAGGIASIGYDIEQDGKEYWVYADSGPMDGQGQGPFKSDKEAKQFIAKQPKEIEPLSVYLSVKNPIRMPDLGVWNFGAIRDQLVRQDSITIKEGDRIWDAWNKDDASGWSALKSVMTKYGYDGIIYTNEQEDVGSDSYVVLSPTQIKSTGNTGTFSDDPNILYSKTVQPKNDTQKSFLQKAGLIKDNRSIVKKIIDYKNRGWDNAKLDIATAADRTAQGLVDRFHAIKLAEQLVKGGVLPAEQSGYVAARLSTGIDSVMKAVLTHGAPVWKGNIVQRKENTKGLLEIFQPVQNDMDSFLGWMVARRAKRLLGEGRERNFTAEEINEGLALAKGKEEAFEAVAKEYDQFRKAVLDLAEQAGLIDATTRPVWDKADHIPFYRMTTEKELKAPGKRLGLSGQTSGIRTLKGGEAAINDPLENIIMNFTHLIDASMKNHALRQTIVNIHDSDLIARIPAQFGQAMVPMSQIKSILKAQGVDVSQLDSSVFQGIQKMWSFQAPTGKDVIRVMDGGKAKYYRVNDQLLLQSLTAIHDAGLNSIIAKALRAPKRLLTAGVTASPDFMLRNFIRDSVSAWVISENHFRLGLDSFRGAWDTLNEGEGTVDMMFSGASFLSGYIDGTDPGKTAKAIRRTLRKKGFKPADQDAFMESIIDTPAKLWEKYRGIGDSLENASREAVYKGALKAGKSKAQAVFEAKDLMDFSMQGSWSAIQWANTAIPFLNARLQGLYKLGRSGALPSYKMRKVAMMRGLGVTLFSLGLYALNYDNDDYEELEDWDKDTYWHLFIGDHHFRIPKPFEIGVIFGTAPERAARLMLGADDAEKSFERFLWNLKEVFAFTPLPQAMTPGIELYANKDTFTGRPIENMSDANKLPADRYNERTSDIMRMLGRQVSNETGISPKQMEHLWTGYLGTMGAYSLSMADYLYRLGTGAPSKPGLRADQIPLVKSLYRTDPPFATKYQTEFYDMLAEANQVAGSINAYKKTQDIDKARELLGKYREQFKQRKFLTKVQQQAQNINKQMDAIYRNTTMSRAKKREELDELLAKKNSLLKKAVLKVQAQSN
jgi:diguanylate cyclase (GGDEF)-like protein